LPYAPLAQDGGAERPDHLHDLGRWHVGGPAESFL